VTNAPHLGPPKLLKATFSTSILLKATFSNSNLLKDTFSNPNLLKATFSNIVARTARR